MDLQRSIIVIEELKIGRSRPIKNNDDSLEAIGSNANLIKWAYFSLDFDI